MSILVLCYRLLLWLYPRSFRDEFGAEMDVIFQEQMHDAAAHSHLAALQICWRELRDWPIHCFQAHWQVRQQRLLMQSTAPSSWRDTAVTRKPCASCTAKGHKVSFCPANGIRGNNCKDRLRGLGTSRRRPTLPL